MMLSLYEWETGIEEAAVFRTFRPSFSGLLWGSSLDLASAADGGIKYSIRPVEKKDLDAIASAERLCYASPWPIERFRCELDNPLAAVDLLLYGGLLAGYLVSWRVCGELHIHNVATLPQFRRRGVARRLLGHVLSRARGEGLEKAFLEVRVGNDGAIGLYRAFGFVDGAIRKRYYPDGEDALQMELDLGKSDLAPGLFIQGESHDV